MTRAPNAVDFWRGFALVEILVNHVPGNFYERFTHKSVAVSDAAELFVFLAGWALAYVAGRPGAPAPLAALMFRLGWRAVTVYGAHIATMMMAIALLAAASIVFENGLYLEWHNAAGVFQNPVETQIGLVALSHQLGYFNILPLYVTLLLAAPFMIGLHRAAPRALLPASLAIYLGALSIPVTIPTWPEPGQWFFNPLAWQLLFALGFLCAREDGLGGAVRRHLPTLRWIAWPIVIVGAAIAWFEIYPDPTQVPRPTLLFIAGKTFLTPMRLIHFLALAVALSNLYSWIERRAAALAGALSLFGRNSLPVFCAGSVLSLMGQILRFATGGGLVFDTAFLVLGLTGMALVGRAAEWRERMR